jgi:hypothetical protein
MDDLNRVAFVVGKPGDLAQSGAPTLRVEALVNVASGHISGHGEIVESVDPPGDRIRIDNVEGRLFPPGINPQARAVTLSGKYNRPTPGGGVPTFPESLEATLVVDENWKGSGTFSYGGKEVADVPVTPVED